MELIGKYFPGLDEHQMEQFRLLVNGVLEWNQKINVISRQDTGHLEERHLLHALAIAKFIRFNPGTRILDVGTGGGFPGLPLAIMFPHCRFTLVDSIAKKIVVVKALAAETALENVTPLQARAETLKEQFDFVISRAVTAFPRFYGWTKKLVSPRSENEIPNGIIYLKGGDLSGELAGFGNRIRILPVGQWFDEPWFAEKKIVYLKI